MISKNLKLFDFFYCNCKIIIGFECYYVHSRAFESTDSSSVLFEKNADHNYSVPIHNVAFFDKKSYQTILNNDFYQNKQHYE